MISKQTEIRSDPNQLENDMYNLISVFQIDQKTVNKIWFRKIEQESKVDSPALGHSCLRCATWPSKSELSHLEKQQRSDVQLSERLSSLQASWRNQIAGLSETPIHQNTIVPRRSRGALNWAPIIPGDEIFFFKPGRNSYLRGPNPTRKIYKKKNPPRGCRVSTGIFRGPIPKAPHCWYTPSNITEVQYPPKGLRGTFGLP